MCICMCACVYMSARKSTHVCVFVVRVFVVRVFVVCVCMCAGQIPCPHDSKNTISSTLEDNKEYLD